jgi:hypothetical protein
LSLLLRRYPWLDRTAAALYGLGAVGAGAAYWTGRRAEETLPHIPPQALGTLADHADWALWTLWVVIPVAFLRLLLAVVDRRSERLTRLGARGALLAAAGLGVGFLVITADRGGEGVFRHGLGVAAVQRAEPLEPEVPTDQQGPPGERLTLGADGALRWTPLPGDAAALGTILTHAPGAPVDTISVEVDADPEGVGLVVSGAALLFLPEEFGNVHVDVELDLSGFEGTVGIVHHGRDFENFEAFVLYPDGSGVLERREGSRIQSLDRGRIPPAGERVRLAVSAVGRHFYGRVDGEMVAHGHAPPWGSGRCGLFLDGAGIVRVFSVTVTPA